ncbi:uncharacterized protein LOC106880688 [Octopus bimaculoides]|uniref:Uncharacterized protein n=1 Tax=Octopus bimaculoides TaxID=37653 RepID=A0A0L8FWL9_OCTBM|nr:uncharacterized protein LOC106880688 [Octopus bimaculoides]XP_014786232.1 uncharacterized protein LOC106880688 [Octopus bimaculoides]|eukprot:XP_014786231.1 PREDICTED: uncharacterized protein LOC106880688 [Octopus bimaculoides]
MSAERQFLSVSAKLPKEWQPHLYEWNPYHCSYPDVAKRGWQKWSADHPDWLSPRATSHHVHWFNRKINNIRRANYKAMNYHYERPSKPTSRLHDQFVSISGEVMPKETSVPMPTMQFFTGSSNLSLVNDVGLQKPKWGQFNPDYYGDPYEHLHLPPLKLGGKEYHRNEYISYTGAQ